MAEHICPWWVGYLLVCPIRRWFQAPDKILSPYITEGMTVLDIGPAMGFFTIPAARMVGYSGKVIAVDVQTDAQVPCQTGRKGRRSQPHCD